MLIPEIDIRALKIPFGCIGADIISGNRVFITDGSLRNAIRGSIAVPGAIMPVKYGDMLISDGGSVEMTPVEELKLLELNSK